VGVGGVDDLGGFGHGVAPVDGLLRSRGKKRKREK
jgi:hypothetical protein